MKKKFLTAALIGAVAAQTFFVNPLEVFAANVNFSTENLSAAEKEIFEKGFYVKKIDAEIFARIKGKSFKDDCIVPVEDLRYIHVLHKNLNGETREGEIVCNAYIAYDLLDIFQKLYLANYPIEKIRLVDEYNADDETSMRDNNSSCFNFRFMSNSKKVSKHGLGLAVDINTLYNPYVKETNGKRFLEPATAGDYVDRKKNFPYKIDQNDLCYKLFIEHGFEWGGNWKTLKDYQHFEIKSDIVKMLYPDFF